MKRNHKQRIGIVTITNDGYNYGNRLQNYALQTVLERMGYEVETLNRPIRFNQLDWWRNKRQLLHYIFPYHQTIEHKKAGNFFLWNKKHIHWSPMLVSDDIDWVTVKTRYDYFVAGSDQIWNPFFPWGKDAYMFLQFSNPSQRVAYAPSIGVETVDNSTLLLFSKYIQNWRALSCRELSGARLLGKISNKPIPCLIDPTLLLSKNDWSKIAQRVHVRKPYIFVYVLGDFEQSHTNYITKLANNSQYHIVDIVRDKCYASSSPSHFLFLIMNSEHVVTDSFHAFVFSIIFQKKITLFNRKGLDFEMTTRFSSLSQILNIPFFNRNDIVEITNNWSTVEKKLEAERQRSESFLFEALS